MGIIKAEGADCDHCPLQEAGKFVPSDGPAEAKIAFVGEAPGAQEARYGKPFIGASGKLLDSVLQHHGIRRGDTLLTNAALCRPPDGSTPPAEAFRACVGRLRGDLQGRHVETVVALGNAAAQTILQTRTGITKLRVGPGKSTSTLPGVRVIPTIHPAACLRAADMFPHLVTDIGKVKFDPNNKWEEPKFVVVDDEVSAMQACGELRPFPELVVDIEVGIEKDTSFDHPNKYQMLCIGVCYAQGKAVVFGEEACKSQVVIEALRELFVKAKLIGQNLKFDLAGLFPLMGSLEAFFDTMIASYVLDERPGIHGLKQMSVEILGAPQYDDELGRYVRGGESYANVPRPVLYKYNAYDVVCTMALYHIFRQRLEDEPAPTQWYLPEGRNLRWLHDFLVGAANQLMFMELNGLKVDIPLLNEMTETYLKRIDDIEEELSLQYSDPAKGPINPRSPIQVKKALAELGVQVESTAKDVLQEICDVKARRGEMDTALFRFCEILLRHRREAKLYGTYIKGTRKRLYMGRVHPTFLVHGTTTGRLSCRNPNLQNVPRESVIRKLFIPTKPGRVFVQPDYSQAELRIACYLAQDEYFREIFNDPTRDLFNELTPVLYPNVGDVDAAAKKELRIRVKAYVYGLAYGREAFSIAQEFKISEREARDGMRRFFDVIPGIVAWRQDVQRRVLQGEDLVTPFGRRRRFWLITNDNKDDVLKEALAFLPQSTSSDICLGAAAELRVRLRGMAFLRNIVHDSILAECDAADADEVTAVMSEVMLKHGKAVVGDYVRFQVDCKVGASWGEV